MRDILFPFQEVALAELHSKINNAHLTWSESNPQIISFSAPTGAGKTIIMTTLFEELLYGNEVNIGDPDSIFIWLSDSPELNEQTRLKIESKSDKIRVRDMTLIDTNFNAEFFEKGQIYFLNTQKLGSDKLLTATSDKRQFSIWETLTNTAKRNPKQFYVVIDEAHRGTYYSAQAENKAQSIMQKFLKGSDDDGLCVMPLIIGVTATPQRFDSLTAGISSTVQKVIVPHEQVRESGLLKDRIIIHYPDIQLSANMTMFKEAVENWKVKCEHWKNYYNLQRERGEENEKEIKPILVVQVEDGSERESTRTDLGVCIDLFEEVIGRKLQVGEIVHTFNDRSIVSVRDIDIQKIEASRIEEDDTVKIVFFKMNLSTGWDCPRAETMMSFRSAHDYTYIAQLLGRMIRTPLARRIAVDAELNNVNLFLPYFDESTVKNVVAALRDSEAAIPSEAGTVKELVTLKRNPEFADIFDAMDDLITYDVDTTRRQPAWKLYVQLARALTMDGIDLTAWRLAKQSLIKQLDNSLAELKENGSYSELVEKITDFSLGTLTFEYGDNVFSIDKETESVSVSDFDISRHFEQAGRVLGEGLHKDYWSAHCSMDHIEVKLELIVLANHMKTLENLNFFAIQEFNRIYENNKRAISKLSEARLNTYNRLINASPEALAKPWTLPETIDFTLSDDGDLFEKHLFCTEDATFKCSLGAWECELIAEELENGIICWMRNLDRKKWSLEIPYEINGVVTPMYPDLLVVRLEATGYVFDILEPHNSSLKDNYLKAVGLAKFADKHWDKFGRIQLVRKQRGLDGNEHLFRLDMSIANVRQKVRGIISNSELDKIFESNAHRED